jgi:tetratricopeptide (TPR) repeat protein
MMRRLFFILFLMTGLACFAQDSQEDTSLTSHPSPLTSQKYDAFFLDAICQREKGNNDAAFDLLRHCVELDSTRSEAYYYLAPYYRAMKDKDRQFYCIKKAAELEPHNATYLETLGEAYIAQRQYAEAAEVLEQLYDVNHNRTDVLGMLIQLYEQLEDYDKAIQMLNKLEIAEGKSERLSYAKSQLYTRKGDKRAAIQEMKQLQEQYPNDLNYLCLYANALTMNDQQKQAIRIYEDVLRQEPDNRSALMGLMAYYYDQKDSAKTEQYRERILLNKNATQEDRVALLRQLIGESEQNGGDSTRVLQLFHRILQMPQNDADMALFCATYMNMKQMPRDSIQAVLEQALAIAPDNAAARLQLVSYAWQAQDRDKVIALCGDARQYNPDEMAYYY